MGAFYTDSEIANLILEPKPLPPDWRTRVTLKEKRGHREREFDVTGTAGSNFRVILRQAVLNRLDFSVILALLAPKTNQVFRLLRCNGKSHEHTNRIESETFYDFHVHRATERYQKEGYPEDGYAQVTDEYSNFDGALDTLLTDGGFVRPPTPQMEMGFPGRPEP